MTRKRIHFLGVGGVGMAGLAVLLKSRGHEITGCDLAETARTRWLASQGIAVSVGHSPDHVQDVDEVVVTPAVRTDNPERRASRVCRCRGEVLAELVNDSDGIAVCGSHGKTTTATWIAKLLLALGEDVSWCIGGETGSFPVAHAAAISQSNNRTIEQSNNSPLVVEADESDGTLALYRAKTLVVTNCEYDHPDHFKTPADYFACFETAKRQAGDVIESEKLGSLESLGSVKSLESLGSVKSVESLGSVESVESLGSVGSTGSLVSRGTLETLKTLSDSLPPHNRKNARAAVEVALRRGHSLDAIAKALPAVVAELPDRRFQVVWPISTHSDTRTLGHSDIRTFKQSNNSLSVVTDYAHHPTEMRNAVGMARQICRGTLRVLYQPHRYSRTKALLRDFPASFAGADEVVLCPTYAAFEPPLEGGDIADLYKVCREEGRGMRDESVGCRILLARSCEEAWEHARNSMREGDLTLLLGAGDIINLVPQVRKDLGTQDARRETRDRRRIWIGQGSNTWKSDLNLSVEYVRTTGPANAPGASLGIPWMAGVPGTVGGWIKMNAGAFGHSISEVLAEVKVDGKWIPAASCGFAYRHSDIVGEIQDFKLKTGDAASSPLQNGPSPLTSADYLARRRKFPAGTYGSFFKNPPSDFAGRLLEASGAKDLRVGGAYVWSEHANVIVCGDGATSSDVLALARLMRNRVLFRFGVALEPEVSGITF